MVEMGTLYLILCYTAMVMNRKKQRTGRSTTETIRVSKIATSSLANRNDSQVSENLTPLRSIHTRTKTEAKAKIFFDVSHLFSHHLFSDLFCFRSRLHFV